MTASSSLRQRRHRRDDEANSNNNYADNTDNTEDDELELFAKHYKQATANNSISQCRTVLFFLVGIIILPLTFIILQYNPSQQRLFSNSNAIHRQDLKLITIYPQHITSQIHNLKSQTEVLITETNKEAIDAIRIGIGMSNNLHYHHTAKSNNINRIRKSKKKGIAGILLGISNYITSLRSSSGNNVDLNVEEEEGYIPGEIVLEPYDEIMIRNYLVEFGSRCSSNHSDGEEENAENTILKRYDEKSTLMQTATATTDDMYKDILWDHIIHLFTLCQFINNDARGYIAFNTTKSNGGKDQLSIQERLEESRLNGVGLVMKQSDNDSSGMLEDGDDSLHYASLFVIPNEEAARDMAREMLNKRLEDEIPSLTTTAKRQYNSLLLLLEITDDQLQ